MSWFKTPEELDTEAKSATKNRLIADVQSHLDTTAQSMGYDNIISLCTYAASTDQKFKQEGQSGVAWRDAVWAYCYQALSDVEEGNRTAPTTEELISELPTYTEGA